jgi:hypothetical protein
MAKMEKLQELRQVKALKWHMDFLSYDFESMADLDLKKSALEVKQYIIKYAYFTPFSFLKYEESDPIGDELHAELERIESPEGSQLRKVLIKVQAELRGLLEAIINPARDIIEVESVERRIASTGTTFVIGHPPPKIDPNDCFNTDTLQRLAKISFTDALSGMPANSINMCEYENCGNYFFHLSEKDKFYCSPKCTSRALAQERREAEKRAKKEGISVKKARERIKERKAQKRKEVLNGS